MWVVALFFVVFKNHPVSNVDVQPCSEELQFRAFECKLEVYADELHMARKKSEYNLKFHVLSNDLRKQIWQENIRFRELRQAVDRADHFWIYQLVQTSDSDDEDADQSEKMTSLLGVKNEVPISKQTKGRSVAEISDRKLKDTGVQTVELQDNVLLNKEPNDKKCSTVDSNTEETEVKYGRSPKKSSSFLHSPEFNKTAETVKGSNYPGYLNNVWPMSATSQRSSDKFASASPSRRSRSDKFASASPSRRSRSPSPRFSVLTRTSRKSHEEQRQPLFADYGWNDSNKNIGDKKTYNTLAPKKEVYPHALQALRDRRSEMEECLAQESQILNGAQTHMMWQHP